MKWHKTFYITEAKLLEFLSGFFEIREIWYQDYSTHELKLDGIKDFIVCRAVKII
jgi:hypothetical protein